MASSAHPEPTQNLRTRYVRPSALELPRLTARERWAAALKSFTTGLVFFLMGALFDLVLQQHGLGAPAIWWGDLLAGVVAGTLVLFYETRRNRELTRRLEMIRLMNHHVRNSLQVISYASSSEDRAVQVEKVRDAIERIDWALREVLPGRVSFNEKKGRDPQ
jgi:two-component sensor histidine kinase